MQDIGYDQICENIIKNVNNNKYIDCENIIKYDNDINYVYAKILKDKIQLKTRYFDYTTDEQINELKIGQYVKIKHNGFVEIQEQKKENQLNVVLGIFNLTKQSYIICPGTQIIIFNNCKTHDAIIEQIDNYKIQKIQNKYIKPIKIINEKQIKKTVCTIIECKI